MKRRHLLALFALSALSASTLGPRRAVADVGAAAVAARATEKILDLDFPAAHALLDAVGGEAPEIVVARARLALYEEECDLAAALLAEAEEADLLVVASHGAGNAVDRLLGSTASAVVGPARCPVLVVPPTDS